MIKAKKNFFTFFYILSLVTVDIFALFISYKIADYFRTDLFQSYFEEFNKIFLYNYLWIGAIIITLLFFEKIYFIRYDFWSDSKRILKALFFSFVAVFMVISLTKMPYEYSRAFLIFFFLTASFLIPMFKRLAKLVLFFFDRFKLNVKVVSNSKQGDILKEEIEENWYLGYSLNNEKYDTVLISSKNFDADKLKQMIKKFSKYTKDIYIIPYMYFLDFSNTNVVDMFNIRLSAIHIENRLLNIKNTILKAISEKILVLFIFPFLLILHIFLVLLVRVSSNGPIIFKQKRFGKNGKVFSCYKYRTMYTDGDKILEKYLLENPDEVKYYDKYHKYKNDPRVTSVGKFLRATSLDEFPQFYNILRGDMNLIGPRPYMLGERKKIGESNEEVILKVKPGITGLWQVFGRNKLSFSERIELDKWYIENWSLWMDFVIFMKTIKVVLGKVGAR